MLKVYLYRSCSTCKKAMKFLNQHEIAYDEKPIVTEPPSLEELRNVCEKAAAGNVKKLFNTSGEMYRSLDMKNKLPTMSKDEALELLAKNGKLIKRPLVAGSSYLVGFKEETWSEALLS